MPKKKPRRLINGVPKVQCIQPGCTRWIIPPDDRWHVCRECRLEYHHIYNHELKILKAIGTR